MAKCALTALKHASPELGARVEGDLVGPGNPIPSWDASSGAANAYAAITIGQLMSSDN